MEDKELFTYEDSFHTEKSIEISKDDFKFVQQDSSIHDLKFDTNQQRSLKMLCVDLLRTNLRLQPLSFWVS